MFQKSTTTDVATRVRFPSTMPLGQWSSRACLCQASLQFFNSPPIKKGYPSFHPSLHQAATPFTPMSSQTVHNPPHPDKSATNKPDRCPKTRYGSRVLFHRAERKYLVLGNNPDHKYFCSATQLQMKGELHQEHPRSGFFTCSGTTNHMRRDSCYSSYIAIQIANCQLPKTT